MHPGGVIIVPDEIQKYVPVLMAPKGVQIVEWEKDQVEDSGLLKIDILGNRSLGGSTRYNKTSQFELRT